MHMYLRGQGSEDKGIHSCVYIYNYIYMYMYIFLCVCIHTHRITWTYRAGSKLQFREGIGESLKDPGASGKGGSRILLEFWSLGI